jgi:MFS family permease
MARIAGPFVGGLLVASFGFHVPLLADGATFLFLGAIPVVLRLDRRPQGSTERGSTMHEAFRGVRLVTTDPVLRSLIVMLVSFIIALGAISVVEIYFVTTALHAGAFGYGVLGCCMGAGMLVVASLSGAISKRFGRPERLLVVGCAALCAGIGAFGLTNQLWQAAVLVVFLGGANALLNVNALVLITRRSTDEVRGRVFAAVQGIISAGSILALSVGGLLLLAFTPRSIILVASLCCALALAFTMPAVLRAGGPAPTTGSETTEEVSEINIEFT